MEYQNYLYGRGFLLPFVLIIVGLCMILRTPFHSDKLPQQKCTIHDIVKYRNSFRVVDSIAQYRSYRYYFNNMTEWQLFDSVTRNSPLEEEVIFSAIQKSDYIVQKITIGDELLFDQYSWFNETKEVIYFIISPGVLLLICVVFSVIGNNNKSKHEDNKSRLGLVEGELIRSEPGKYYLYKLRESFIFVVMVKGELTSYRVSETEVDDDTKCIKMSKDIVKNPVLYMHRKI